MLAADAQQVRQSIQAARAAMKRGDLTAADSHGRMLIDYERWQDARSVYEDMLALSPSSLRARYGLATVYLNIGDCEQAESIFDALIKEGNNRPEIRFMRGRARLDLGEIDAGRRDVQDAHTKQPTDFSLRTLAGTLWMLNERDRFDSLLDGALRQPELLAAAADLMRQSGKPEQAIAALSRQKELTLEAYVALIQSYIDVDDPVAAEKSARTCLAVDPGNTVIDASLISALLMQGKADEALTRIMPLRGAEPERQHWIAYEATALRILGDPRYDALVDMDRFVRPYQLPVPRGFDSLAEFNSAFLTALDRLHRYARHPLNQTLRHGSQTTRELSRVDDPVIAAFFAALDTPIRDYLRTVGDSKAHPLTARNTGNYRIAGSWSVRLHGGGWHVNHVHPEGWISSAYYVSVPDDVADESLKAGWIKFGEPPFRTTPPTPAQKWVRPSAGLVVLFPSFMWHGTEAIFDDSVRVTAPFDLLPA